MMRKLDTLKNFIFVIPLVTLILPAGLLADTLKNGNCATDYSPCTCSTLQRDIIITCTETAIEDVFNMFNSSKVETSILEFHLLKFNPTDDGIPNNLLGSRIVEMIDIECKDYTPLYISDDAFKATKWATKEIKITNCDLNKSSSMLFLEGFVQLVSLRMEGISDMSIIFPNFPIRFESMASLIMINCRGWANLKQKPRKMFSGNLKDLYLIDSYDMNDFAMNLILDWVFESFQVTLANVIISNNNLTEIPSQFVDLILLSFILDNNNFLLVPTKSISLNKRMKVSLSNSNVEEIQPGAFQGSFTNTQVQLIGNKLTKFESTVFQNILQEGGSVDVKGNPFDCGVDTCHLAWLFDDSLLNLVANAQCSNGTKFEDLDQSFFAECFASSTDNLESSLETSSIKLIEESQSSTVINSKTSPPQTEDTASSSESTLSYPTRTEVSFETAVDQTTVFYSTLTTSKSTQLMKTDSGKSTQPSLMISSYTTNSGSSNIYFECILNYVGFWLLMLPIRSLQTLLTSQ